MIVSTTPTIEGKRMAQYLGLVSGEAILGANIFKDLFAGIRDIVGGRSGAYEEELRKAKQIAIGIGSGGNMLMVSASGTAVVVES